jgi:thiosulfate/3-mercaptopyruvate sulfurtransferase
MPFTTLVDTATLAAHLGNPGWVVVDCRFMLTDRAWGSREYLARHIPGAVYAHLDDDLSGSRSGHNGRHPLPDAVALARVLGGFGISNGVQVVAYDQDGGSFASRLWWLLRWMGHDDAAVLDGGIARWIAEERPTASGKETRPARIFAGSPHPELVAGLDEIARTSSSRRLIDVRAAERYRGEVEPVDRVPGHIPGAVNDYFMQNLNEQGMFRATDVLRARLVAVLGSARPDEAICYCGSGVTACHELLALEIAGLPGARLYPGSWSEWSSDPSRPVERAANENRQPGPG